jgi:hypothetical protein
MRTTLLCLLAALAANALFAWWGRTTFVPLGLVVVGGLLLSILLGVLAAVIHGFSKRSPNRDSRLTLRMLLVGVVFFSSTLLGLPLVQRLIRADVAATRAEVENLAAALERYHTQHGHYPEALDEHITTAPPLPPAARTRVLPLPRYQLCLPHPHPGQPGGGRDLPQPGPDLAAGLREEFRISNV